MHVKILTFILIISFLFLYKYFKVKNYYNNKYYRCNKRKIGKITSKIFKKFNLKKNNDDWNVYIPCGYNYVEKELREIKLNGNKNKVIFGINGCDKIVSKNGLWKVLKDTYTRKFAKELMPESYILYDPNEIKLLRDDFMDNIRKNKSENNFYILKKNIQRKEGLKLSKNLEDILKSKKEKYMVAQKYLRDLYLVNRRKVNLRIYLLVIIKGDNKKYYLCKKGKCIYTKKEYNDDDFDFESNITSYHLDMNVYKKNPRTFTELVNHLNNDNKDGKKLFDKIEKLMYYVCQSIDPHLYQSKNIKGTTTFQIFGADVIFDNNLHPYLLEFNKGPDMRARDKIDEFMKSDVQYDMFSLVGFVPKSLSTNSFFMIYPK